MTLLTRRGLLLAGLASLAAPAVAAPAIVRASWMMPIYVPRREVLTPDMLRAEISALNMRPGDFTIEWWLMPRDTGGVFVHSAIVCSGDKVMAYRDGVLCDAASTEITALRRVASAAARRRIHAGLCLDAPILDAVYVDSLKVSSVARQIVRTA